MTSNINPDTWQHHAWRNRLQAIFLLVFMTGFLALLGWLLWGVMGLFLLIFIGVTFVLFTPRLSPLLVMRMYRAQAIAPQQSPQLWNLMRDLAERAGLDYVPRLFYVPSQVLNAFAAGSRGNAAVAVTDGLLRSMNSRELAGILAHEMSHIRNNDVWVMNLADMLSRATRMLSLFGQLLLLLNLPLLMVGAVTINWFAIALLIFAPTLTALAQLALARNREFDADLNGARLTGDPDGLASALDKLERIQGGWMEQLFIPNRRAYEPSLLRTHPDTEERIRRLMALKPKLARQQVEPLETVFDLLQHAGQPVSRSPRRHITGLWY
jgi:heat shock protein HtpX